MAAEELKGIVELIQPLIRGLISAIRNPPIGLKQGCRAEVFIAIPPVTRAAGSATEAQDTFPESIKFFAFLRTLQTFLGRRGRISGLQPGLNGSVLSRGEAEVRHQIFNDIEMGEGGDGHLALTLLNRCNASQRIGAVNIHGAGSTNPFPARPTEGEGGIDFILNLE